MHVKVIPQLCHRVKEFHFNQNVISGIRNKTEGAREYALHAEGL